MPNQIGTSHVIRFATFEVDLQAQELRKSGLRLKLIGQPIQVLAILLEQPFRKPHSIAARNILIPCGRPTSILWVPETEDFGQTKGMEIGVSGAYLVGEIRFVAIPA